MKHLLASAAAACLLAAGSPALASNCGVLFNAECNARLDASVLWSFGLQKAAVARLCVSPGIREAMPEVCIHYLPRPAIQDYSPAYTPEVRVAGRRKLMQ
jgi:hypothetical protein